MKSSQYIVQSLWLAAWLWLGADYCRVTLAQAPVFSVLAAQYKANPVPARAIALSIAYQNRAVWFQKTPQYNHDSTEFYYQKSVSLLENVRPLPYERLAEIYYAISDYYLRSYRDTKAAQAISKAWAYFEAMTKAGKQNKQLQYNILRTWSLIKIDNADGGDSKKSLQLIQKALTIFQDDERPIIQAMVLRDKGEFYHRYGNGTQLGRLTLSFQALDKSRRLYESFKNPADNQSRSDIYKSMVWYYNVTENADSCDYYFAKLKNLLPALQDPILSSWYYALRGNTLNRRKQYEEARPLIEKSLKITEIYHLEYGHIYPFSLNLLGVIATEEGRYEEAMAYFVKGRDWGIKNKFPQTNTTFLEHLTDLYEKKGDYKQALLYHQKWANMELDYSATRSEKNLHENELQLNILSQQKQLSEQKSQQNSFIAAIIITVLITVLLAIILFGLYRNFRNKQRINNQLEILNTDLASKNKLLDKRNADNELLLKEIHHRVKNNLEVVSSLLALQSAQISDPDVQEAMQSSQSRVQSMGILHQQLYQNEHLAFIEMKEYFVNLSENILDSYNETGRIEVLCEMKEVALDVDTAIPVGLIVNELLTNALKYAFPSGQLGRVLLSLEDIGANVLQLRISDNGIGQVSNSKPQGTGFGTQLVALLTRQLDGTMQQDLTNGTTISIQFQKK
jgi:two-component system, sensor histidine kinase PdtaS